MGEARRRRLAKTETVPERVFPSGLTFAEIEEIASEDPDDREIRLAHGMRRDDPYDAPCANGCGLTYEDVSSGKIHICRARAALAGV